MTPPSISVITPSLNQGVFIEDAILSVARQNYPNFEHIVVDGGSTDETLATLRRYPHLRWISEPDRGQSDAINKGFQMAGGDLVVWLNADDYYLPGAFAAIGRFAEANPSADVIYGDCVFVDRWGRLVRYKTEHGFDRLVLLYYGCYIDSTAFLARRLVKEGLLLDISYRACMDYEYFVHLANAGKTFAYLNRPLTAFRWHGSNCSLDLEKVRKEQMRVRRKWSALRLPDTGYDALEQILRTKRVVRKILNGNYWTELKARSHQGMDTRWFQSGGVVMRERA
jgi:glycosyltransferase involved in cell wall biosynthesis